MSINTLPDRLLKKLKCTACGKSVWGSDQTDTLHCTSCGIRYPMHSGCFPDFLTDNQKKQLNAEIDFWEKHFGQTVYENENEASYRAWADLIKAGKTDEVIELGCGSGAQLRRLNVDFRVGLEPVLGLLTATTGFFGIVGAVESIPFHDESFDLVYFNYSLHHVNDKEKGFAEAVRITRTGGRVVAIEPNAEHPQRRLINKKDSPLRRCRLLVGFVDPVETFFSAAEVTRLALDHGLVREELIYRESMYDRPTLRFRLQQIYSKYGRFFLPDRFIYPSFYISFRKI